MVSAAAETLDSSVTSSLSVMTFGAGRLAFWAAVFISGIRDSRDERAAMMIVEAPALAKLRVVARPTPFDAPVIRTDFPDRLALVGSIDGYVSLWIVAVKSKPGVFVSRDLQKVDSRISSLPADESLPTGLSDIVICSIISCFKKYLQKGSVPVPGFLSLYVSSTITFYVI